MAFKPELAKISESKQLHFDIRSLDPGKFSYPYHFHRNAEEIFIILSGKATLRKPDGYLELSEGDIIFFEMGGPEGAHQIYNHTEQPCEFLDIRTVVDVDICEYPDSGKINILPYREIYKSVDKVDYFKDEELVKEKWPKEIINSINNQ